MPALITLTRARTKPSVQLDVPLLFAASFIREPRFPRDKSNRPYIRQLGRCIHHCYTWASRSERCRIIMKEIKKWKPATYRKHAPFFVYIYINFSSGEQIMMIGIFVFRCSMHRFSVLEWYFNSVAMILLFPTKICSLTLFYPTILSKKIKTKSVI